MGTTRCYAAPAVRISLLLYGLAPGARALSIQPFAHRNAGERPAWVVTPRETGVDDMIAGPVEPAS